MLPTRLFDTRNHTLVSQLTETNPTNAKLAINRPRATADTTARLASRRILRLSQRFGNFWFTRHVGSFFEL